MSLYGLKPRFVYFLAPVIKHLAVRGARPTWVTLAAIPVASLAAIALISGRQSPGLWLAVPILSTGLMVINAVDGHLARSTGQTTSLGGALNELIDRLADLLLIGSGFFLVSTSLASGVLVAVLAAEVVSLIGWGSTGERSLVGTMGKPDRAVVLSIGAVGAFFIGMTTFTVVFLVLLVGSIVTVVQRVGYVAGQARRLDHGGKT